MDFSVIISVYKKLDYLALILKALDKQSIKSFEVIISEDNDLEETKKFLDYQRQIVSYPIKHYFQEDNGFRKNKALNQSIKLSKGKSIAFLDGDCIPHRHFLKGFKDNLTAQSACYGRRVCLNEKITQKIINNQTLEFNNLFNTAFRTERGWRYGAYLPFKFVNSNSKKGGIYGCNWAVNKDLLLAINGFDEDYVLAGFGEDVDIEWRLMKIGIQLKSTRNKAIVYHLYHTPNYSEEEVQINKKMFLEKLNENNAICKNGIVKL